MNENLIKQAVTAGQSAIIASLGASATTQNCLEAVEHMVILLLTCLGKHDKKTSFHNLDIFHRELEAMILNSRATPHAHH
jgi:hypothetical protein